MIGRNGSALRRLPHSTGRRLGASLAKRRWRQEERELLAWQGKASAFHVIGTSVGAFAADAFVTSYVTASMERDQWVPDQMKGARGESTAHAVRSIHRAAERTTVQRVGPGQLWPLCRLCRAYYEYGRSCTLYERADQGLLCPGCDEREARKEFKPPNTGNFFNDLGARFLLGHNWPMGWYARTLEVELDTNGRVMIPSHQDLPRGEVLTID